MGIAVALPILREESISASLMGRTWFGNGDGQGMSPVSDQCGAGGFTGAVKPVAELSNQPVPFS
jgi:hypothetical protein